MDTSTFVTNNWRFQLFMKKVKRDIRAESRHEDVYNELLDMVCCFVDENLADGFLPEEAVKFAIKSMGSAQKIGKSFNRRINSLASVFGKNSLYNLLLRE